MRFSKIGTPLRNPGSKVEQAVLKPSDNFSGGKPMQCARSFQFVLAITLVLVIFAITSAQAQSYTETVLYSFQGGTDGAIPLAGLVMDAQVNRYGTTYQGGTSKMGTVFKVDATGKETVLYSFTGTGGDGANPYGGLVLDAQGNLYGTTYQGGTSSKG